MSYHKRRPTEFEVQQSILLGAQISGKHAEFQIWAMQDPDTAFLIWLLENPNADFLAMLRAYASIEFLKGTTEVTRLAMIVGSEEDIADLSRQAKRDNTPSQDT